MPTTTSITGPEWPQLVSTSLSDAAYLAVRDQIVAGRIAPGEFIRERSVGAALRVSRTPLREALGRLATEGFLERLPNLGYRVSATPIQDLLDLYPVVAALEGVAARTTLPQLTAGDLKSLRQLNREMQAAVAAHDPARAIRVNELFHQGLTARTGNRRLEKLLDELRTQLASLEIWSATRLDMGAEAVRQHRAIIQAVAEGDFAAALEILHANRMQTWTALTARGAREKAGAGARKRS